MSSLIQKCNDDNIPLADDDPQVIITDDVDNNRLDHGRSMDSLPSSYTGGSSSPGLNGPASFEPDSGIDEQEEKARLISQVLELQNTLDGNHVALFLHVDPYFINFEITLILHVY